jgi:hypothetical protein
MTREAKPGELRGIQILELMERLSRRPESRMDLQKLFDNLSEPVKNYAKHLVSSGPSGNAAAAKACGMTKEQINEVADELLSLLNQLRK